MPTRRESDPLGSFNFAVEIEGVTQGPFLSVEFLETETAVMVNKRGNDLRVHKTPGRHNYANIVMRRAYMIHQSINNTCTNAIAFNIVLSKRFERPLQLMVAWSKQPAWIPRCFSTAARR